MPSADTAVVGRRCAKWLIDCAIAFVPTFALLIVMMFAVMPYRSLWYLPGPVFIVLLLLANLAIYVWTPHRNGGRTPGMRLLGLRIVTEWGSTPKLGAYVLRLLLMVVDGFALCLPGLLAMLLSPRHQRVGDLVARTLVVRSVPTGRDHPGDSPHQHGDAAQQQDALDH